MANTPDPRFRPAAIFAADGATLKKVIQPQLKPLGWKSSGKAKISQAINALADEGNFAEAGRQDLLRIEVVHHIPRPPFEDGPVYTINPSPTMPRPLEISLVFVTRESRYAMPE